MDLGRGVDADLAGRQARVAVGDGVAVGGIADADAFEVGLVACGPVIACTSDSVRREQHAGKCGHQIRAQHGRTLAWYRFEYLPGFLKVNGPLYQDWRRR
ncbi:unnamed protein product [Phytophthora fragariaefolia]|uniref:Unnamed protein product n=1 Tax=Phytophthora fragariaefolia TaxID=1490495 RepID=A0A9W6XGW9_9STRA|nr:unnamed protein product [Phytophthora fragariaefolia]